MAYEMKNGQISVFKNDNATEKQPQYRGTLKWNDEELEVSLWVVESKAGLKYLQGQIKEKWTRTTEKSSDAHDDLATKSEDGLPF